jgi:hypothetical protein
MRRAEAEKALLTRLESAFDQLAIQNASSTGDASILRNETTDAARAGSRISTANTSAKLKPTRAASTTDESGAHPRDVLASRLNQLHQEKQHRELGIIDHYSRELANLSTRWSPSPNATELEPSTSSFDSTEIDQRVRSLTKDLEWAVFETRQKAGVANDNLKAAQRSLDSQGDLTSQTQVHALGLVRDELTKWIEERLLVCGDGENADEGTEAVAAGDGTVPEDDLQNTFDAFAAARINLLQILNSRAEAPATESLDNQADESVRMVLLQIQDPVFRLEQRSVASTLRNGDDQARSYLGSQIQHEHEETVEMLQRLADESQLLPAYPMLNRSEKYSNARKVFGDKQEERPDEATEHAQAWSFAADAASETNNTKISQHLLEGDSAVKKADQSIQDFSFLKDMSTER